MAAIVFDLDGTLISSVGDLHAAANRTLADVGAGALTLDQVRGFIGNGVPKLVERVMRAANLPVSPDNRADMTARFMAHYEADPVSLTTVFDGAREALEACRDQGHKLGICTNKPQRPAEIVLDLLGLAPLFDVVVGGDALPTRKPDPAMLHHALNLLKCDQTLFVGDSEIDADTALAAKVPFALYTEGYRKRSLDQMNALFSFEHFTEFTSLIARTLK